MTSTFDLHIDRLVYGGDGMGRLEDGRAVFVPFVIHGERVRVRLVEEKASFARAELVELLEPGAGRVQPRCVHFGTCGGCHYQHMDYASQVQAKSAILQEQLERMGGLTYIPQVEVHPSPDPWCYRNHLQFHLAREGGLGFQHRRTNQAFAITECHLPEEPISWLWPQLEIEPVSGLERVSLRCGVQFELMVVVESTRAQPLEFEIEGVPLSVVHQAPQGSVVLAGSDHLVMEVSGRRFVVSAGSFFQVNTRMVQAMVEHLLGNLVLDGSMTMLDVYCGVGLFSAFIAPKVKSLVGIELSADACEDFTTNLDEFDNVSLYEAAAEAVLGSTQFDPQVIIVDPPREGLGKATLEGILSQGAQQLVYVSCDPATLGRDARQLVAGGYQLERLAMFDMFPQTFHLESVMWMTRK